MAGEEQKACWGHMLHGLDSLGSEGAEWALCYLPPNTLLPNAGPGLEREGGQRALTGVCVCVCATGE